MDIGTGFTIVFVSIVVMMGAVAIADAIEDGKTKREKYHHDEKENK